MMYEWFFRRVLARIDPERAHHLSFLAMRAAARVPGVARAARRRLAPDQPIDAFGLRFAGPLGIAAGFDKNAVGIDAISALGFSFVEVGTVTAQPQPGNPKPRLARLINDRAIVNRMGFNNDGAEVVARRLAKWRKGRPSSRRPIVGVNIGKTKLAHDEIADYVQSTRLLAPHADYLVVNVSSPNTPGLRDLQAVDRLRPLLAAVRDAARVDHGETPVSERSRPAFAHDQREHRAPVPLLVKIAPDLADDDVLAVADLTLELGLDGIVATNTTIARDGLTTPAPEVEAAGSGGLSGPVLQARSLDVLRILRKRLGSDLTLISVGGITTSGDIVERLEAGATLVQAYTGFIYGGPLWPSRVQRNRDREEHR